MFCGKNIRAFAEGQGKISQKKSCLSRNDYAKKSSLFVRAGYRGASADFTGRSAQEEAP